MTREEVISKVQKLKGGVEGGETSDLDEKEVERTFCLSRSDDWVINSKMKRIIFLEFKRTSDTSETYYSDMKKVEEKQTHPS